MTDGVEARVSTLEKRVDDLDELVDGHEPWSHRTKLHNLKDNQDAVRVAAEALKVYRNERLGWRSQIREWGAFALAAVAIMLSRGWL